MEISVNRSTLYATITITSLLVLSGLAFLGKVFTTISASGQARLLSWNDWQKLKAEARFKSERELLRSEAEALASRLNMAPDPVAIQLLSQQILQHTRTGVLVLERARAALLQAAQDTTSWAAGSLDRETAMASLQAAIELLR